MSPVALRDGAAIDERGGASLHLPAGAVAGGEARPTGLGLLRLHPALVIVAGSCAALLREALHTGIAGDVFYTLAAGRWMLAHHAIMRQDLFSYSVRGRPWLDEEWGFQYLLAWLVSHVGAISYWVVSGGACCGALIASVARWRSNKAGWLWTGCLSILAAGGMFLFVTPRPQDLSYLFFALLLLFLSLARRQPRWLFLVPPLLVVWANLHGSFLTALGVLALELLWSLLPPLKGRLKVSQPLQRKQIAATLVASAAATLVNPHGPALLSYALKVSSAPQLTALIEEWQSPNFHSYFLMIVIIGPVLLLVGLLAFTETRFALEEVVLAGLCLVATLHAVRFMPYLVLAMCAALSRWAPVKRETIKPTVLAVPLAGVLAAAFLAGPHTPAGAVQGGTGTMSTPVAATSFLRHQTGRVFTTYWWSDYLDYESVPVFVDGRTDLYFGTDILGTYVDVAGVTVDPDSVFKRWDVRWVMWDKGEALTVYLSNDRAWERAYEAGDAVVFEHVGTW